jgi:hypothetical protein
MFPALTEPPGIDVAVPCQPSHINRQPYHPPGQSDNLFVLWLRRCLLLHKYVSARRFFPNENQLLFPDPTAPPNSFELLGSFCSYVFLKSSTSPVNPLLLSCCCGLLKFHPARDVRISLLGVPRPFKMYPLLVPIIILALILSTTSAAPTKRLSANGPAIPIDFADPSLINVDKKWYAFGTTNGRYNVQIAQSGDFNSWGVLGKDALPTLPPWAKSPVWAPDVIQRVNSAASLSQQYVLTASRTMVHS